MITTDEEMVSMDENGTVKRRSPRAITEEDVAWICAGAVKRSKGQLFPDQDLQEKSIPIPPLPGQSKLGRKLVDCSAKPTGHQSGEICGSIPGIAMMQEESLRTFRG